MKSTKLRSWTEALLGAGAVNAPPHVFELSETALRYARFESQKGSLAGRFFRQVELPEEIFQSGALGGPLRDAEAFERSLGELLANLDVTVDRASLLLPDKWLRTVVVDMGETPWRSDEEVLRWRLKKHVPFRVEDLRLQAVEVNGSGDGRVLVGFAIEQLVAGVESAFRKCGIRIGQVTNRSLATTSAISDVPELRSIVVLDDHCYSLVFAVARRAVMLRYKALDPKDLGDGLEAVVRQDLRITRGFIRQELPDQTLSRTLFCGPPSSEEAWLPLLEECLGAPTVRLGEEDLRPTSLPMAEPWHVMAPLLGAAGMEVR